MRQDVLQKDKMGMKYVGHAENTVLSPEITKTPKVQWSRWQEFNCDCYVWLLFITSGVFLPTTDELCNLARGVDTRNVQLDPRTKTALMLQLKAAPSSRPLFWPCVCLPSVSRPHLLFAQKAALFPSTLTFGFRQKVRHSQSSYFVKLISSAACGVGWGGVDCAAIRDSIDRDRFTTSDKEPVVQ